jgi:hypothetical protein
MTTPVCSSQTGIYTTTKHIGEHLRVSFTLKVASLRYAEAYIGGYMPVGGIEPGSLDLRCYAAKSAGPAAEAG